MFEGYSAMRTGKLYQGMSYNRLLFYQKYQSVLFFSYPIALSLVASGAVNVKPLVTHKFKLEESMKAFETAERGEGIKVIIQCTKE